MDIGMYQGAAALHGYEQWQRNISHNLAASEVAGYKREAFALEKKPMGSIPTETDNRFARLLLGSSPQTVARTDFSAGPIISTEKPTDVALQTEGFFEVQTAQGASLYTRDGEFHWNNENVLVNKNGHAVQSADGGPITRVLDDGPITINRHGEIWQNGNQIGVVGVFRFERPDQVLLHTAGGFVVPQGINAAPVAVAPEEVDMVQGYKENGNVSAVQEMVNMITVSRAFENNQKVINAFDSRYGQAIQALTPV